MTTSNNARTIEQKLLASVHGSTLGAAIQVLKNTSTSFDLAATSAAQGFALGIMLANEEPAFRAHMVARLNRDRGHDPAHDAEAIAQIRTGSATIRHSLDDDAVARQFARLVAEHALTAIAALTAVAAEQRASSN